MKAAVFDAILDAFKQDSCITRSISVSDRDEEDVSELFLTQLADPATRLAKGLRRLVLNAVLHDEAANIIGDIIRKNNRLQYLQVRVSSWCFSELSYSLVPDGRYSEAHVVERVVGTPLPMRTKCAILSVFVPHQKLPDDQSFHLDMLVLTQIFGFAAEPTKSQIVILRLRTTRNVDKQPGHRMSCRHMEPPIQTLLSTWFLDTREARIKEPTASAERGRMTEPAEAWGFLDGRFETLRRQLMLFEMEDTDVPWIKFMSLDMTDDRLKRCREALLLIGAMGTYVDTRVHSVWRSKMQDILWTGISLERLGGQPLMPAFDMSRAFAVDHTQEWEATMELLLGYDDLSESFDQDWSRLCEAARAQGLHVGHPHEIPILLTFTLSNEAYEDVQIKSLQVIRECLRKFQQSAAAVARLHPCRPRFQLEGVQLDARHLLVTPRTIPRLLEVLALDIPIETLYMPTGLSRPKGSSWRNAWASLLFTVFGDPRAKVKTSRPIKTVDAYFTSQYMYRALCSVLVQTTNVHKFVCSGSSHPEHFTWKWLYYALFSKPASVRSVVLNDFDDSNVNPSDMDPLYATYPHSQLLEGSTIDDDIDLGTVLLPKGTVIRFAPFQANDKTVVKGPNGEVFQIIRKNPASTTIDILVPGYGNGIVDRGSALEKRQRLSNSLESVPATSSAVTNLVVLDCHHSDGVADQVSQLIARVGQSLESLKIAAFDVDEEVIRHVLKTCPNLSHFSPGRITRPAFDLLLDAFERDCAIRSLILFEHHEIDNMAEQVLERVADRTTRLAKRLTRLQVVSSPLPRKAAHHVAEIVRTNNRLQYLYVFVSSQSFTTLNYPPVATGRDGVAHVIERVVGVALPMRAKCALLSVFVPSRLSVHLDRLVLTQIFEFAAEPAQSQIVTVKCAGTEKDEEDMEQ